MTELKIVKVAVENIALSFDTLFDYRVPTELLGKVEVGCRVLVPFGRANTKKIGMIFEVCKKTDAPVLKNITAILDDSPIMNANHLELAKYISQTTFCPLYEAVKVQLPSGMHLKLSECYEAVPDCSFENLSDDAAAILKMLSASQKPVRRQKLFERFGFVDDKILLEMESLGVIKKSASATKQIGDKTLKTARLIEGDFSNLKLTDKQKSVISVLEDIGEASIKDICYFTGVTVGVINTLNKKGIIELFDAEIMRLEIPLNASADADSIKLSNSQEKAYNGLRELILKDEPAAALLYGVTGSGKTQVFLKLIEDTLKKGKTAIVMVPEISLTAQTVKTFYKYFGKSVAVLHSGLSVGERYDEFKRIRSGEVGVVVGTRSAVFAPLDNIGIIVMDEEQEATYKSESSPRYHAREVAKFICTKNNALLLLASATPLVDSYYNAQSGRYKLFTIDKRYGKVNLPEVTIVDMADRDLALRDSAFCPTLIEEIEKNLNNKEQTILLYNRRGYHTVAVCGDCKTPVTCPNCSIALTYHKKNNRLMCHYCGYSTELIEACPNCDSKRMFYKGQGTQRVEDELEILFPNARILRMDMDNTSGKGQHQKQFDAFEKGDYDILVGTQMVAKGLNFPKVTLVGVLNADQTLYSNDYRAYERGFSLITQVVGRSGRGEKSGRAIIQTMTPQNNVISLAAMQDYPSFYEQEISMRKAMLYPPFCDLCTVGFVSQNHDEAKKGALKFIEQIKMQEPDKKGIPLRVLGPSAMNVVKIGGKYRYRLIIKCKNNRSFRELILNALKDFQLDKANKNITAYADLNNIGNM